MAANGDALKLANRDVACFRATGFQLPDSLLADLIGSTDGLNLQQQATSAVEVDQRCGASVICLQSDRYRLWTVVVSLKQLAAAFIALACSFRRPLRFVIDGFAFLAGPAAPQAGNDLIKRKLITDDRVQNDSFFF